MNFNPHLESMVKAVTSSINQKLREFCHDHEVEELTPAVAAEVSQGLQEVLSTAGRAGYLRFIESYDVDVPLIEMEGKVYRRKPKSSRTVMTAFGRMKVTRHLYQQDRGGRSHIPLDEMWGVRDEYATPEVREAVLFTVAHVTAEETSAILKKCATFHPSTTAIQKMAERAGHIIEANEKAWNHALREEEEAPQGTKSLVVSLDGVNVALNEPGSRMGRPRERPFSTSSEGKTSYRNVMVGSCSFYGSVPPEAHAPKRFLSRYTSHMPEERGITFKKRFEEEVAHSERLSGPESTKVVLCDGARSLWKYIDSNPRFDGYEKLLDFYHATEHLSKAAEAIFGKGSSAGKTWYDSWRDKLIREEGAVGSLLRSIDYYRRARKIPKSRKKDIERERGFFQRNNHRMRYATFMKKGLAIGSGPVEAACKTIVKTRMCRSGMRWSREGGQHILHLRTFVKAGRWDAFWNQYLMRRGA